MSGAEEVQAPRPIIQPEVGQVLPEPENAPARPVAPEPELGPPTPVQPEPEVTAPVEPENATPVEPENVTVTHPIELGDKGLDRGKEAFSEIIALGVPLTKESGVDDVMGQLATLSQNPWTNDAQTQEYIRQGIIEARTRAAETGEKALEELIHKGYVVVPDSNADTLLQHLVTEQQWENTPETKQYIQEAIDLARIKVGEGAFTEISSRGVTIDRKSKEEELMQALEAKGWINDALTQKYIANAIFFARCTQ